MQENRMLFRVQNVSSVSCSFSQRKLLVHKVIIFCRQAIQ